MSEPRTLVEHVAASHPVLGWLVEHEPVEVGPHHHHYINQTASGVTMTDTVHGHFGDDAKDAAAAHSGKVAPRGYGPPCTLPCHAVSR